MINKQIIIRMPIENEIETNKLKDLNLAQQSSINQLSEDEIKRKIQFYKEKFKDIEASWDEIGFVRPLGGFFYNYILVIVGALMSFVFMGFLLSLLYPWPEAEGYRAIAGVYFSLLFSIMDIGTAYGIERFVAENRIKNVEKMIKYLQFFIWYQMWTGLFQTTFVSLWAIYYIPQTTLAYAVWIFLIISTTQYPGFLGFFKASLKGLQQFNKTAILDFIGQNIFQQATNIIFIIWGRMWGASNPAIGELMGLAIGAAIGSYVDDFFATMLSIYYFDKTVREFGYSWKDAFHHDFEWDIVKECLVFGAKVAIGPLWGTFVGFSINMLWIVYIPQWATFASLSGIARGVANLVKMGEGIHLVPAISESFLNGKNYLAQFYISQTFKYWTFFAIPMIFIIEAFLPAVLRAVLQIQGAQNYVLALGFIFPWMLFNLQENVTHAADHIIVGASRPNFLMMTRLLEETGKLLLMIMWIVWLQIPQKYGITAIAWVHAMGIWPAVIAKTLAGWWYINSRIVKVHVPIWQTFIAPLGASLVMLFSSQLYLSTIYPILFEAQGALAAGVISLLFAFLVNFGFVYLCFYGIFGGFDEFGYRVFTKAVEISGPSKPLMKAIWFFTTLGIKISPLHNKFPIQSLKAEYEAYELMEQRDELDKKIKVV